MEKLTCKQVRQFDMVDYLASLGYQPAKIHGQDYWYLSPLRTENTASFKVSRKLNLWYDHGMGTGGNLVDFGLLYHKCSIPDLLRRLESYTPSINLSFHQPPTYPASAAGEKKKVQDSPMEILSIGELKSPALRSYLESRAVRLEDAAMYCHEVEFLLYGKPYTSIGFRNNSGGYELRSQDYKGSSSPKDMSLLQNDPSDSINVYEGFIDFLSSLSLNEVSHDNTSFLILNSLAFADKSIKLLEPFKEVSLYMDQDQAGRNITALLKTALPQANDASQFYASYKDLNEYQQQKQIRIKQEQEKQIKQTKPRLRR
ncbi:toprim domain-containing protein [Sphingobacterium sp.]|uniref:toprim domain-containing protein n=1 Tax=Sphingobacterium sp. TaxID=341027 RepID=UPI00289D259B|nr:toprim domain-containing protein [Sphingobacterium sp.]